MNLIIAINRSSNLRVIFACHYSKGQAGLQILSLAAHRQQDKQPGWSANPLGDLLVGGHSDSARPAVR